ANTTTVINDTVCGIGEFGCTEVTNQCPAGYTDGGGTCSMQQTQPACPNSNYPYFYTSGWNTRRCQVSSGNTSNIAHSCTGGWNLPSSSGTNRNCNRTVTDNRVTRYQHTNYGRNQAYAFSIRVQVCDGTLDTRSLCTAYGNNHKPEGLLQQNSKKTRYSLFAYLTQ